VSESGCEKPIVFRGDVFTKGQMRARLTAAFVLLGAIWGSEWLVTRGLDSQPLGALALRYAIAVCLLGTVALVRRIRLPGLRLVMISAITGVSFAAVPGLLIGWASGRISPGLLVVILAMTPLLAALMEGRASGGLLATLVGGVAGTALLASQGLSFALTQWAGAAAVLGSAALIAVSVLWAKRELTAVPLVLLAAIQLASAAIVVALWSWIVEGRSGFDWDGKLVWTEAALAVVGSAVALPLYYWLLRERESFQLTASQWVVTIVGVGEGLWFVREAPGWRMLAGAAILAASLAALLRSERGRESPVTIGLTGVSPS
jgi:drug/metabolite transporter (DMT)-like permease